MFDLEQEYTMHDVSQPTLRMIELPPGRYRLAYWSTYNLNNTVNLEKYDLSKSISSKIITINTDKVTHIGNIFVDFQFMGGNEHASGWRIGVKFKESQLSELLFFISTQYPNYSIQLFDTSQGFFPVHGVD